MNRLAGVVGVYVHLHQREIADDHHAVADAGQAGAEFVDVVLGHAGVHILDDEFGAILELDLLHRIVIILKFEGRRAADVGGGILDLFAVKGCAPALEHGQQTLSAGIDHARLLERREHVRSLFQNGLTAADDLIQQLGQVARMLDHIAAGILRDHADDGQDGALLRLHNGLVRRLRAGLKPLRERFRVDGLRPVDAARKAAQNLGEDDAGVAARALERAAGGHAEQLAGARLVQRRNLLDGGFHRQGHIGARVAVRHGENVQRVNRLAVLFKQIGSRNNHFLEEQSVY